MINNEQIIKRDKDITFLKDQCGERNMCMSGLDEHLWKGQRGK